MQEYFDYLYKYYGNHTKVAFALGVTPRHYRNIRKRNGKDLPLYSQNLIKYLAQVVYLKKVVKHLEEQIK